MWNMSHLFLHSHLKSSLCCSFLLFLFFIRVIIWHNYTQTNNHNYDDHVYDSEYMHFYNSLAISLDIAYFTGTVIFSFFLIIGGLGHSAIVLLSISCNFLNRFTVPSTTCCIRWLYDYCVCFANSVSVNGIRTFREKMTLIMLSASSWSCGVTKYRHDALSFSIPSCKKLQTISPIHDIHLDLVGSTAAISLTTGWCGFRVVSYAYHCGIAACLI